jgi:hypothetical protein
MNSWTVPRICVALVKSSPTLRIVYFDRCHWLKGNWNALTVRCAAPSKLMEPVVVWPTRIMICDPTTSHVYMRSVRTYFFKTIMLDYYNLSVFISEVISASCFTLGSSFLGLVVTSILGNMLTSSTFYLARCFATLHHSFQTLLVRIAEK